MPRPEVLSTSQAWPEAIPLSLKRLKSHRKHLKTRGSSWFFIGFHIYDFISMLFRSLGKGVVTELQVPDGHGVRGEDTGDRSGTVPGALRMLLCTSPPYVGP